MKTLFILPLFLGMTFSPSSGKWPKAVKDAYMKSCVDSAIEGMSKKQAKKYCACTMRKVETLYPDPTKLSEIGQDVIEKIAKECLGL